MTALRDELGHVLGLNQTDGDRETLRWLEQPENKDCLDSNIGVLQPTNSNAVYAVGSWWGNLIQLATTIAVNAQKGREAARGGFSLTAPYRIESPLKGLTEVAGPSAHSVKKEAVEKKPAPAAFLKDISFFFKYFIGKIRKAFSFSAAKLRRLLPRRINYALIAKNGLVIALSQITGEKAENIALRFKDIPMKVIDGQVCLNLAKALEMLENDFVAHSNSAGHKVIIHEGSFVLITLDQEQVDLWHAKAVLEPYRKIPLARPVNTLLL